MKIKLNGSLITRPSLLVGAVIVFALISLALPVLLRADTPTTGSFEAEAGIRSGNAQQVSDAGASGGSAIKFAQSSGEVGSCSGAAPMAFTYNPLTGRGWPTNYGQAYVATWKDDKIAAVTLGVDDNIKADHEWWKQKAAETGFKFTWFVITQEDANGKLMTGATWADFRALQNLGHSVQSHSIDGSYPATDAGFRQSQTDIGQGTGIKPLVHAYPNGVADNRADAAKYYIAARGTTGWLNSYKPDYMDINSLSTYMNTSSPNNYNYAPALIDKSFTQDSNPDFYRGWMSIHYHSIANDKPTVESHLSWLKTREADIWVGTFDDVAQYAQERDAAQLSVTNAGANCVAFNVTDTLNNTTFDEPLTVKIRLQDTNDWSTVSAQQGGKQLNARIVTNNSNKYALVDVVPDAGPVTVYNPNFN